MTGLVTLVLLYGILGLLHLYDVIRIIPFVIQWMCNLWRMWLTRFVGNGGIPCLRLMLLDRNYLVDRLVRFRIALREVLWLNLVGLLIRTMLLRMNCYRLFLLFLDWLLDALVRMGRLIISLLLLCPLYLFI